MSGYVGNVEELVAGNTNFRHVIHTAKFCQLVLMSLLPSEEIGSEVHDVDQFFRFESGTGKVVIDGEEHAVSAGFVVVVSAGSTHNVINMSATDRLQLYTLYCPPHHPDGTIHVTKPQE